MRSRAYRRLRRRKLEQRIELVFFLDDLFFLVIDVFIVIEFVVLLVEFILFVEFIQHDGLKLQL